MSRSTAISVLRTRIARQDRKNSHDWPIAHFGAEEIDAALPDKGLTTGTLHEFLPAGYGDFSASLGFGLGMLSRILQQRSGHVIWVRPAHQRLSQGTLYPSGLAAFGIDPDRVIHVNAPKPKNMLWALDEALTNQAVAAAIGFLAENDRTYDFTASRRLAMRAASHGATALLFTSQPGFAMATAAETRWSVKPASSQPMHRRGQPVPGLGVPRWHIRLTKCRRGGAGQWHLEWNHETLSFRLAAPLADRAPVRLPGHAPGQWIAA